MAKKGPIDKNISSRNIGEVCTEALQIYGVNIKVMRYIPGAIDGLKSVERRILMAAYDVEAFHDKPHKKSVKTLSKAMDRHPHGDSSVYDSMVAMTQPWTTNCPLLDIHGNFGSVTGGREAAFRYTETRLSFYAYKCFFEDFSMKLANTRLTNLQDELEPEYLPARYPNVLLNNSFGMGWGAATGVPNHNLKEVLELAIAFIDDPLIEDVTLIPDSPTFCNIVDEGQFKELCETGKGNFKMRGETEVDEEKGIIKIKSVPLQVDEAGIIQTINKLVEEGKVTNIDCVLSIPTNKTSNKSGFETQIVMKPGADPYPMLNLLYKHPKIRLQRTVSINYKLIDSYTDVDLNVRSVLAIWLEARQEYKTRMYTAKLVVAKERQHILETILMIFTGKNAEKALSVVRNSKNNAESVKYLMDEFNITSLQANRIVDMKIAAFQADSIERYKKELITLIKNIAIYDKMIRSVKKINAEIKEELREGIKLFAVDRKSDVVSPEGDLKIRDTKHLVVVTKDGLIKKMAHDVDGIGTIENGDHPFEILTNISNTKDILIFDTSGKVTKLSLHTIPSTPVDSGGVKLSDYCNISGRIVSIVEKPTMESIELIKFPVYFLMITKKGIIKKTLVKSYINIKSDLKGMTVNSDDELMAVKFLAGDKDILVYTNLGFGVRFASTNINDTNRMSKGVKSIDLNGEEVVIGMDIINTKDDRIFILTSRGTGKTCTLKNFNTMNRASKPLRIITLDDNEEVVLMRTVKGKERFNVYLKTTIEEINVEDVPELPRLSKGKKLIGVAKGNAIVDIAEIK